MKKLPWWTPPLWVGLGVGAVGLLGGIIPTAGRGLQIWMLDQLFWSDRGPRLGRHAPPPNLVLIEPDERTVVTLGSPSPVNDLRLYKVLLDHGAKFIADTRLLAAVDEALPLLDGLVKLNAPGRVVRDLAVSTGNMKPEYVPYISSTGRSGDAVTDSTNVERSVPLLGFAGGQLQETQVVQAVRAELGIPRHNSVVALAKESGILGTWQKWLPKNVRLSAPFDGGHGIPKGLYDPGGLATPWAELPTGSSWVPPAQIFLNYGAPAEGLRIESYVDVLSERTPGEVFAGRVVVIGNPVIAERLFIPSSPGRPVGEAPVFAYAFQTLAERHFLKPVSDSLWCSSILALSLAGAILSARRKALPSVVAVVLGLLAYMTVATFAVRSGWIPSLFTGPASFLTSSVVVTGLRLRREERLRRRVTNLFGRYVAKRVVDDILMQPESAVLSVGGVTKEITVLFADVRGFTTYSDHFPPERVVKELNSILSLMVACAFDQDGTVDKYIGDAMLVLFNAPQNQPDHALRAVRAAWAMQRALEGHASGLAFGIGIHVGEAVVGTVGTPERMEYTAIGATVNLSSRLCGTAARGEIAISEEVQRLVSREFSTLQRPPMRVKGLERELNTYLVTGPILAPASSR